MCLSVYLSVFPSTFLSLCHPHLSFLPPLSLPRFIVTYVQSSHAIPGLVFHRHQVEVMTFIL